jgi:TRAP-type C4-dicarboxylate transport system substrate-binding protein
MTKFITAACLAISGCMTFSSAALAEKLVVTTNLPPTHWASTQGGIPFMKCVTDSTKGEVEFDYYDSGKLANFFESLNAVNNGIAQVSYIVVSAQSDKLPLTGITLLPGLGVSTVDSTVATRKVLDGDGPIAKEYLGNNIVPLMINVFPAYQMMSTGKPFDTLAAMQGRRISSGGGSLLVTLSTLGATAIESSSGDLYLALQQGTMDGTMLSTASIKPYSLQEVVKSVSGNGNFGIAAGVWSIDSSIWAGLPEAHKDAFRTCGLKVELELAAFADKMVAEVQTELKGQGIDVFDYTPEALKEIDVKLEAARQDYIGRLKARGLDSEKAYADYVGALKK